MCHIYTVVSLSQLDISILDGATVINKAFLIVIAV